MDMDIDGDHGVYSSTSMYAITDIAKWTSIYTRDKLREIGEVFT